MSGLSNFVEAMFYGLDSGTSQHGNETVVVVRGGVVILLTQMTERD